MNSPLWQMMDYGFGGISDASAPWESEDHTTESSAEGDDDSKASKRLQDDLLLSHLATSMLEDKSLSTAFAESPLLHNVVWAAKIWPAGIRTVSREDIDYAQQSSDEEAASMLEDKVSGCFWRRGPLFYIYHHPKTENPSSKISSKPPDTTERLD